MDDGSIVFLLHPEFDDWNTYFDNITLDATRAGWVRMTVGDSHLTAIGHFCKRRVTKILKNSFDSGSPIRNFFTLQLDPKETGGRTTEVVEITLLEKTGAVLFVSYYGYD